MENKIIVNVINGEMSMDEQNAYINIMKENIMTAILNQSI